MEGLESRGRRIYNGIPLGKGCMGYPGVGEYDLLTRIGLLEEVVDALPLCPSRHEVEVALRVLADILDGIVGALKPHLEVGPRQSPVL
jgi:hypothetical protein